MRLISFVWLVMLLGMVYFSTVIFMEIGNVDRVGYLVVKK